MTPGALVRARDGSGTASAAATALWAAIVARSNVDTEHAGAALDMISQHVGGDTDVADAVLREAVVRLAYYLKNTDRLGGFTEFAVGEFKVSLQSEFHGAALRRSGVMGLLVPWTAKRAGAI